MRCVKHEVFSSAVMCCRGILYVPTWRASEMLLSWSMVRIPGERLFSVPHLYTGRSWTSRLAMGPPCVDTLCRGITGYHCCPGKAVSYTVCPGVSVGNLKKHSAGWVVVSNLGSVTQSWVCSSTMLGSGERLRCGYSA